MADQTEKKLRPTKDTLVQHIQELHAKVSSDIETKKKTSEPTKGLVLYRRRLEALEKEAKTVLRIKKEKPATSNRINSFEIPVEVKPELAEFLQLEEGDKVSRMDIRMAFKTYLYRDPDGTLGPKQEKWKWLNEKKKGGSYRDLRDPENRGAYLPDATIKKLLKTDQYQKDVKAGKIMSKRKDPEYVGKIEEVRTDPSITDKALLGLYEKLIIPKKKAPIKKGTAKKGAPKKGKKAVEVEEEEEEVESEEEEVEEKPKKKVLVKKPKKKVVIVEDDEVEEEEDEDEDD